ncbi:MAG TPA: oligosaccharide flippase family protein [Vicinamibacterales bacterium]|nr:oligosaccharide flippase family protein [Vicinamibacterales bacterium]
MTSGDSPLARVARLSAAFLGSNLARAGIGFGLSFALARGLGADGFGRWILCTAWASTLTVVSDLGLGVLLTRDGARERAEAGRLLIAGLVLRLSLAIPLAAVLYAGAAFISSDPQTIAGLRIAALLGTAGAAYGCFGALLRSQPRWLPTVLAIETGWLAIQLISAWWLVSLGIVVLMMLAVLVQVAQIVTAVALWRLVFGERGRVYAPSIGVLRVFARRAMPFAASGIVANLQTRVGPLMLGYLSTSPEVGFFAAASRFGSVARLVPQAMFAGALPVLSHEHGRDGAAAERMARAFDAMLLGGSAAVAIGSALFAVPVLRLVYGPSFTPAAPALIWVSVGLIPLLSNSGRKVFLYATGGEASVVRWSTVGVILQVVFGAVLIPALGSVGAAASLAAGEAVIWWPLRRASRQTGHSDDRSSAADALAVG